MDFLFVVTLFYQDVYHFTTLIWDSNYNLFTACHNTVVFCHGVEKDKQKAEIRLNAEGKFATHRFLKDISNNMDKS